MKSEAKKVTDAINVEFVDFVDPVLINKPCLEVMEIVNIYAICCEEVDGFYGTNSLPDGAVTVTFGLN